MTNRFVQLLLDLPRPAKRLVVVTMDALLCAATVWLALSLRVDRFVLLHDNMWVATTLSAAVAIPVFAAFGLYRAIFRYAGWTALTVVARAVLVYGVVYACLLFVLVLPGVPRTLGVLQPLLLLLAVGASRALARYWLGGMYMSRLQRGALPAVLIYGAGSAGRQLAAGLAQGHEMRVVGFLDDDARLHGQIMGGWRVYNPASLADRVQSLDVNTVLLAMPSASRQRRNEILEMARVARVGVRTLPGLMDLASGHVHVSDLRELDIEDLLGRDAVEPDPVLLARNIRGQVVLVTGAGGSIGSELCRKIIRQGPRTLLLVEISEFALYAVHQELAQLQSGEKGATVELVPLLASVRDEKRMAEVMQSWHPDIVYHAAAYKHVPLVEHNPAEGIKNNVMGTRVTARVAAEAGVANFVLISTDKAVRPTNIMGASKRVAEMVLQAMAATAQQQGWRTQFSMVRFGNVLGSSGSVVPLFRRQIKDGGPITLTHADITRYFMTIPEAAQLVIQAGAMANGGDVFVLNMGEPVRIIDLARRMVDLSGLVVRDAAQPEGDIEIQITGMRPGEKLYEELLIGDNPMPTGHPRIMKAHEDFVRWPELLAQLEVLDTALQANDIPQVRTLLKLLVPGYQPDGDVVDWVHLAQKGLDAAGQGAGPGRDCAEEPSTAR